jgi:hypothetical protein
LIKVKDDEVAKAIAKMLYDESDAFNNRIDQLPYSDLHIEIRNVIDYYKVQPKSSESDNFDFDTTF